MSSISRIALAGLLALWANAHAVGLLPTPVLRNVQVSADAVSSGPFSAYVYSYTVSNGSASSGEITEIRLDVTFPQGQNAMAGNSFGLTIPLGSQRVDFSLLASRLVQVNQAQETPGFFSFGSVVPFGQDVPSGWSGGLGIGGYAGFGTTGGGPGILPGASLSGFRMESFGVPTSGSMRS